MLRKLFTSRARAARPAAAVPPGRRVYAIGDIHGRADLLDQLVARIDQDEAARGPADTLLIFLGDVVDRGPASAAVIDRLCALAEERGNVRFLKGNHEEIFLGAIEGEPKALRLFCRIGGRETTLSYGIAADAYDRMDYEELAHALATVVPREHAAFLEAFEDMIVLGDYVFVHAGIRPDVPLEEQRGKDLRWIREPFLDYDGRLERTVVHGHTISDELDVQGHRIGVDTGAFSTGRLTALALEGEEMWTVVATG